MKDNEKVDSLIEDIDPNKDVVRGFNIQVNPDIVVYKRFVYNILDLLGDVGGLIQALKLIGIIFLMLLGQTDSLTGHLVKSLFTSPCV